MKSVHISILLAVTALFSALGCTHKAQDVPTPVIPPVVTHVFPNAKMTGIFNWHGTQNNQCFLCTPQTDTTYNIVDTFGWVILDSFTIIKQSNRYYGNDTLKLTAVNDSVITFNYNMSYGFEKVEFNTKNSSMQYTYWWYDSGENGTTSLVTP